jgi:hypothetical protein
MRFGRKPRMFSEEANNDLVRRISSNRMEAFRVSFPARYAWICTNFTDLLAIECRAAIVNLQPLSAQQEQQLDERCLADFF